MSLTINHNLMANAASRSLNDHYGALGVSTRRLSSGLRIGTAADDAAGLAIRELMRADISSLNQGIRNVNDAISMIQTADGALQVVDEKLIRMKELATQASTGTYNSDQRIIIDSEFKAMASEVQRISLATEFNGIKLLDNNLHNATGDWGWSLQNEHLTHDADGLSSTGPAKIHFGTGRDKAEDYYFVDVGNAQIGALLEPNEFTANGSVKANNTVGGAQSNPKIVGLADGGYLVAWESDQNDAGDIVAQKYDRSGKVVKDEFLLNVSTTGQQSDISLTALSHGGFVAAYTDLATSEVKYQIYDSDVNRWGAEINLGSGSDISVSGLSVGGFVATWKDGAGDIIRDQFHSGANPNPVTLDSNGGTTATTGLAGGGYVSIWSEASGSGNDVLGQIHDDRGLPVGGQIILGSSSSFSDLPEVTGLADGGFVVAWEDVNTAPTDTNNAWVKRFDAAGSEISSFPMGSDGPTSVLNLDQANPDVVSLAGGGFVVTWEELGTGPGDHSLYGQAYDSSGGLVSDVFLIDDNLNEKTSSLTSLTDGGFAVTYSSPVDGTSDIFVKKYNPSHNIKTQSNAQHMLAKLDDAIIAKDNIRASLGSTQNRLENTITNLSIQAENLQAAESRISDVDVATEMTEFVRQQILTQSAVAMLSQANSLPKMAMQLIGG